LLRRGKKMRELDPDGPIRCGCGKPLRKNWGKICSRCGCQNCTDCTIKIGGKWVCPMCMTYEELTDRTAQEA